MSTEMMLAQASAITAYAKLMQSKGLHARGLWARAEAEKIIKSAGAQSQMQTMPVALAA